MTAAFSFDHKQLAASKPFDLQNTCSCYHPCYHLGHQTPAQTSTDQPKAACVTSWNDDGHEKIHVTDMFFFVPLSAWAADIFCHGAVLTCGVLWW